MYDDLIMVNIDSKFKMDRQNYRSQTSVTFGYYMFIYTEYEILYQSNDEQPILNHPNSQIDSFPPSPLAHWPNPFPTSLHLNLLPLQL